MYISSRFRTLKHIHTSMHEIEMFQFKKLKSEKNKHLKVMSSSGLSSYNQSAYGEDKYSGNYRDAETGLRDGAHEEHYPSGVRRYAEEYTYGKRTGKVENYDEASHLHGIQKGYYSNGIVAYHNNYDHGKKHGLQLTWYPSGLPQSEEDYVYGKKVGKQEHFDENGKRDGPHEDYYPSGKIHYRSNYLHGRKHGPQDVWDEAGNLTSHENYIEGIRV